MCAMGSRVGCLVAILALGSTRTVLAQSTSVSSLRLDVEGHLGWTEGQHNGGLTLGITPHIRYKLLTAGVDLKGATIILNSMGSFSAVAGLAIPLEFVRLDAMAELGLSSYAAAGSNFLNNDPGASATLPFAGGRASLLIRVYHTPRGEDVWIGPSIDYAKDLRSTTRTYTYRYQGEDWFNGGYDDYSTTRTVRIGQSRLSYLLTIGVTLPL